MEGPETVTVSAPRPRARSRVIVGLLLCGVIGACGSVIYREAEKRSAAADTSNYKLVFDLPAGWKALPRSPSTLFIFEHQPTGIQMRGAANQIVADVNPTPELDTAGIAKYYIDRTRENMPGWTAEELDWVDAGNTRFKIIRRGVGRRTVVTAYAVKGNTTAMVSLIAPNHTRAQTDAALPGFRTYLSGLALEPTTIE